jgi:hypothetical protein
MTAFWSFPASLSRAASKETTPEQVDPVIGTGAIAGIVTLTKGTKKEQ